MKKKDNMKWLVIGLLILIGICVALTALIIAHKINSEPVMKYEKEANTKELLDEKETLDTEKLAEVIEEEPVISYDDINVLITENGNLYHDILYIKSDVPWRIGEQIINAGEVICVNDYFKDNKTNSIEIQLCDDTGNLALCDENGNSIKPEYSGSFFVYPYEDEEEKENGVVLVNRLPIEDYVRYVLPSEMPSYFSYEALKAQAICARTLAIKQRGSLAYEKWNADLDDTTNFQVFNDLGTNEVSDRAVSDTKGLILCYEDKPIECYYYSTSAGYSNDLSVWEKENLSYVVSKNNTSGEKLDLTQEQELDKFLTEMPNSYDFASPFYRWEATIDLSKINDEEFKKIKEFTIANRVASGYINEIRVKYDGGSTFLTGEYEIRKLLGKGLTSLTLADGSKRDSFSALPSSCFVITNKNKKVYTLKGAGFGHGIGMSQYGASKMAEDGLNYKAILAFYYKEVDIKDLRENP